MPTSLSQSPQSLYHTPGIYALVAPARERGLATVHVPAIDDGRPRGSKESARRNVRTTGGQ